MRKQVGLQGEKVQAIKELSSFFNAVRQAVFHFKPNGFDSRKAKDGILPPFDKQIWQRSFYDHIIRNRDDYNEIYKYIYENPMKWQSDQLYTEE